MKRKNNRMIILFLTVLLLLFGVFAMIFLSHNEKMESEAKKDELDFSTQTDDTNDDIESFAIKSKYCTLYYPTIWKEQIEVKYNDKMGYKVELYGKLEGKEKQPLFNICFNSDEGELLGYFNRSDEVINVSVERLEVEYDDSWTEEEMNQIYSMQEDMNYVIEMLNYEEGYVNP